MNYSTEESVFQSLFAAPCPLPVTTLMWDLYFQQADPLFLLFLGLVMVINSRDNIVNLKDLPKDAIITALSALPSALQESDVQDFCSLAQYYSGRTPGSFRQMLQAGDGYKTAVQGLLSAQKQALDAGSTARGEHLVFMGCGDLEQDQYTHMVVASFLRDSSRYVSILNGGYQALHQYFGDSVGRLLLDHNTEACLVCLENGSSDTPISGDANNVQSPSKDLFGKIGAVVKSKSVEVKEKLLEYIVNPGASDMERHVKPSDKKGKRYRNTAPVFSIDDDQDPQGQG